ncbi:MAG: hypothetical protein ACE3L7_33505 [Candidatus Pristimantibacillus sp.]
MDVNRIFSLKKPCADCPFRKDGTMLPSLHPNRMQDIVHSLHEDRPFHCHKTIDYNKTDKVDQVDDATYCAGSLLYLTKLGEFNLPMRMGIALKLFNPELLSGHDEIIDPKDYDNKRRVSKRNDLSE